ncbi:MAG: NADPH-dependent FMN reductase, partial [Woeseia sp.]
VSGSLRRESLNTRLLQAARERMPASSELTLESIAGVPLYNFDDESVSGIPPRVAELKAAFASADGILICSPEYNNSMPGVLKNAIDWMSRPAADIRTVFGNRPLALMGATPGGFGTVLAQNAWLPVMRTLGVSLWNGGRLIAPRASALFDDQGHLVDEAMGERLATFLNGFVEFVRKSA